MACGYKVNSCVYNLDKFIYLFISKDKDLNKFVITGRFDKDSEYDSNEGLTTIESFETKEEAEVALQSIYNLMDK